MLQGDHSGVEVATESHAGLLQSGGLLSPEVRMTASAPLRSSTGAEGLVIDDYFAVSIQDKHADQESTEAREKYDRAQQLYRDHDLLGAPHKDIVNQDEGRVIGAYINASGRATKRGLVTVASPPQKRLALSRLSLLLCQLSHAADSFHLCLIGGWVSSLGFRRPMMSILQKSFAVVDYHRCI